MLVVSNASFNLKNGIDIHESKNGRSAKIHNAFHGVFTMKMDIFKATLFLVDEVDMVIYIYVFITYTQELIYIYMYILYMV